MSKRHLSFVCFGCRPIRKSYPHNSVAIANRPLACHTDSRQNVGGRDESSFLPELARRGVRYRTKAILLETVAHEVYQLATGLLSSLEKELSRESYLMFNGLPVQATALVVTLMSTPSSVHKQSTYFMISPILNRASIQTGNGEHITDTSGTM